MRIFLSKIYDYHENSPNARLDAQGDVANLSRV